MGEALHLSFRPHDKPQSWVPSTRSRPTAHRARSPASSRPALLVLFTTLRATPPTSRPLSALFRSSPPERSKLATARRLLSSLSPSHPSRASTVCSNVSPVSSRRSSPNRHVLFLASRRILPRPKRSNRSRTSQTQKRPRSRTLTAVHDAILTDLVYPVEIVGKRLRTKEDGSKVLKVVLDEKEKGGVDHRLDTYSEVYRKLTGRDVGFEFPQSGPAEY